MSHDKARCQILFCALCLNPKVAASQGREEEAQAERGDGMLHDYAGCQFLLCALCQDYAEGYASGKQKAHAEVRLGAGSSRAGLRLQPVPERPGCRA